VNAARALLDGIIDYAGLFPPASLTMARALENYAEYASGPHAWMLGKFVVPTTRLDELASCCRKLFKGKTPRPIHLALIVGADVQADLKAAQKFVPGRRSYAEIRSLEIKANSERVAREIGMALDELPEVTQVFLEIPADNPRPLVRTIASMGLCAKLRTGGVTADAFPTAAQVVGFMRECLDAGVPFKATAGLHHPVCAVYPLTYETNAPSAPMFGFLNVWLAAGVLSLRGSDDDALVILQETDPSAFRFTPTFVAWRDIRLSVEAVYRLRVHGANAFGSCSFTEPVADLERLGVLT